MERLTKRKMDAFGIVRYWTNARKPEVVQKLGAYEDLGLTPEEIQNALLERVAAPGGEEDAEG